MLLIFKPVPARDEALCADNRTRRKLLERSTRDCAVQWWRQVGSRWFRRSIHTRVAHLWERRRNKARNLQTSITRDQHRTLQYELCAATTIRWPQQSQLLSQCLWRATTIARSWNPKRLRAGPCFVRSSSRPPILQRQWTGTVPPGENDWCEQARWRAMRRRGEAVTGRRSDRATKCPVLQNYPVARILQNPSLVFSPRHTVPASLTHSNTTTPPRPPPSLPRPAFRWRLWSWDPTRESHADLPQR